MAKVGGVLGMASRGRDESGGNRRIPVWLGGSRGWRRLAATVIRTSTPSGTTGTAKIST